MVPEVPSGGLSTVQGSADQGTLALVLQTELLATNDVILSRTWGLQVGAPDVCSADIQLVQSRTCQGDPDTLS